MMEKQDDEDALVPQWMEGQPAPLMVLEMVACKCSRVCKASTCQCMKNGLVCTYLCKHNAQKCHNLESEPVRSLGMDDIEEEVAY